jgi:glutaredoxin
MASSTVSCPYCGETIPKNAAACPHCGSDEQTGWSDRTYLDGIDIGDEVDYTELRNREFSSRGVRRMPLWQLLTAGLLLLLFLAAVVRSIL